MYVDASCISFAIAAVTDDQNSDLKHVVSAVLWVRSQAAVSLG
jgi:hypothetical protein